MPEMQETPALMWILEILAKYQIPYQISGGLAARMYGSTRQLYDIDIDIPEERFAAVKRDVETYISYGPDWFKNECLELMLMTLNYNGQKIDLRGATKARIFNRAVGLWQ